MKVLNVNYYVKADGKKYLAIKTDQGIIFVNGGLVEYAIKNPKTKK